jgi:hypothetical protein
VKFVQTYTSQGDEYSAVITTHFDVAKTKKKGFIQILSSQIEDLLAIKYG